MSRPAAAGRHCLDAIGRLHFAVHQALRDADYPGFACQMIVRCGGSVDETGLRRGLDRLARRYPILTARLDREPGRRGEIFWQPQEGASCPLAVADCPPGEAALLGEAERLMQSPFDLTEGRPIRFHLLRREGEGDVLIVYYDHTLIGDSHATMRLVRELDELARADADPAPAAPEPDELDDYVQRHGFFRRWGKTIRLFSAYGKLRPPLMLGATESGLTPDACRIDSLTLDERETAEFLAGVKRACGFPNPSMGLLAACYRALHRAGGSPEGRDRCLATGIGYSLRPATDDGALFRWFGTEMIIPAWFDELHDREELTRRLVQRMREQIRSGFDVASLHVARIGSRHVEKIRRGFKRRTRETSFSYGFFRGGDRLAHLCSAPVLDVEHLIMPWSPPGLTISATAGRGRLRFLVGSCRDAVPDERLGAFLDHLREELSLSG